MEVLNIEEEKEREKMSKDKNLQQKENLSNIKPPSREKASGEIIKKQDLSDKEEEKKSAKGLKSALAGLEKMDGEDDMFEGFSKIAKTIKKVNFFR